MTTQNIFDLVDTWALSGGPYTSIKMNATDNDAASASLLMDLQVGGVSKFKVNKGGDLSFSNQITGFQFYNSGLILAANGTYPFFYDATSFRASSTSTIGWTSQGTGYGAVSDTILTRRAAANLRLGAADTTGTTAPTPQFLSAQSWSSSTTNNQTGANFTIDGSQGTGTGAGGSIIFRVAPAGGTSNGVQNGLSAALTIASDRTTTFAANVYFTNTSAGFTFSNSATFSAVANGTTLANFDGGGSQCVNFGSTGIGFGATTGYNSADVRLLRDTTNTLALRNGTAAQTFRVYNTYDGTNNEWGALDWVLNATSFSVGTFKSGSGSSRNLQFVVGGTNIATFAASGHMLWNTDNNYDIGASGTTRPRNVYAGTSITPGAGVVVASLPTPTTGMIARVTNALAPATGATVVGGGAAQALVWYNGANWTVIGV